MENFNLNVAFTNDQLATFYATGTNVVVAKPAGVGSANVAWLVFKPLQSNKLEWKEEYGIYASTSEVKNGARLSQLSATKIGVPSNKLFTLEPSGAMIGPNTGGAPGSYSLLNQYDRPYLTVGLFQNATVNGTDIIGNALSAVPVLKESTIEMTPFTTVYIWLQSNVISNTVVSSVSSNRTELVFGGTKTSVNLSYDSHLGKFIETPLGTEKFDGTISHLEASL